MPMELLGDELHNKVIEIKKNLQGNERKILDENLKVIILESLLSINYFALVMREILNRSLSRQTKNNNIKTQPWYKTYGYNEKNPDTISSKQKYLYIALDNIFPKDFLFKTTDLEEKIEELCKCGMSLNQYAHFSSKKKTNKYFDRKRYEEIITIIFDYFNFIENTIPDITNSLKDEINSSINEALYKYFKNNKNKFHDTNTFGDPKSKLETINYFEDPAEELFSLKIVISGTLDKIYKDGFVIEDAFIYIGELIVRYEKNIDDYFITSIIVEEISVSNA